MIDMRFGNYLIALSFFVGALAPLSFAHAVDGKSMAASVFFIPSKTVPELKTKFLETPLTGKKVKILIVPGHEPDFGGAEYRNLKERDLVLDITENLKNFLSQNERYDVVVSRDRNGWNPDLATYFQNNWDSIGMFVDSKKQEMRMMISDGRVEEYSDGLLHNDAPKDVARRLYGITKWANENGVDITLHVHINDSPRRYVTRPGEYSGFAIYTPEKQYSNAEASNALARHLFLRLSKFFGVSNLLPESRGIVENQDLIAIGSHNTADSASMLIEYGYIYEISLQTPAIRTLILKEFALQTYLGLEDFFGVNSSVIAPHETTLLPYRWNSTVRKSKTPSKAALALQTALLQQGFYPPYGFSKNECPLSGIFGGCTKIALAQFQKKFNIAGDGSFAGERTRATLNKIYSN